jgi:hypothetical protein
MMLSFEGSCGYGYRPDTTAKLIAAGLFSSNDVASTSERCESARRPNLMRDRRRFGPPYARDCPAPRIGTRTGSVGGIDRPPQYVAELRCLARLDPVEHELIGLHDVVETKVPDGSVARELVDEVATEHMRPVLARAA